MLFFRSAASILRRKKHLKPKWLPITEDLQTLNTTLNSCMKDSASSISQRFNDDDYRTLSMATLASVILFNRRQSGEASRLLLSSFTCRTTDKPNEEVMKSLSFLETKLVQHYTRIETEGKRSRIVPVILTPLLFYFLKFPKTYLRVRFYKTICLGSWFFIKMP